jgi:hypothetical protein
MGWNLHIMGIEWNASKSTYSSIAKVKMIVDEAAVGYLKPSRPTSVHRGS